MDVVGEMLPERVALTLLASQLFRKAEIMIGGPKRVIACEWLGNLHRLNSRPRPGSRLGSLNEEVGQTLPIDGVNLAEPVIPAGVLLSVTVPVGCAVSASVEAAFDCRMLRCAVPIQGW